MSIISMKTTEKPVLADGGLHSGRWTEQEHQDFLVGLHLHGREWKKVSHRIRTRTSAQIRSHAQKYFAKLHKDEREQDRLATAAAAAAAAAAGVTAPSYVEVRARALQANNGQPVPRKRAPAPRKAPPVFPGAMSNQRVSNVLSGLITRRSQVLRVLQQADDPRSEFELGQLRAEARRLETEIGDLRELCTPSPTPSPRPLFVSAVPAVRQAMAGCVSPRSRATVQALSDDEIQALQALARCSSSSPSACADLGMTPVEDSEEDGLLAKRLKHSHAAQQSSQSSQYLYY